MDEKDVLNSLTEQVISAAIAVHHALVGSSLSTPLSCSPI
jgi:hypothetical protein